MKNELDKEEKKVLFRTTMKWELVLLAVEIFIIPEVAKLGLPYVIGTIVLTLLGIVLFLYFKPPAPPNV